MEAAPGGEVCEDAEENIQGVTATEARREKEGVAGGATTAAPAEGAAAGAAHTKKIMLRAIEQQPDPAASFFYDYQLCCPFKQQSAYITLFFTIHSFGAPVSCFFCPSYVLLLLFFQLMDSGYGSCNF